MAANIEFFEISPWSSVYGSPKAAFGASIAFRTVYIIYDTGEDACEPEC
jgi:hypothetical protein